jgi:hypothetical protein
MNATFFARKALARRSAAPNLTGARAIAAAGVAGAMTWRLLMGTADNTMGGSYGAREFGPAEWAGARWRRHGGSRWTTFEIIAMILGFIVFWPIGLAILGYKVWQGRYGGPDLQTLAANKWQDARMMASNSSWSSSWGCGAMSRASRFYASSTGNAAFDEWRTAELARLDEERRKLDDAQREFAEYVDAIRRAKDREEFERFMAERRARPAGGGGSEAH